MGSPFLSIIIPVFNVEGYLAQCLDSIFNQGIDDVEVIAVNDGSTDESVSILQQYASLEWDFRIIEQENKGPSCARNIGIDEARGRYLIFLDSDDLLAPGSLESIRIMDWKEQYDFIEFDYIHFENGLDIDQVLDQTPERGLFGGKTEGSGQDLFVDWVKNDFFWTSANSRVYLTDFILRNSLRFPEGVFFEDTIWTPKVFKLAIRAKYEPILVYLRRFNRQGSTMNKYRNEVDEKRFKDWFFISQALYDLAQEENNTAAFSDAIQGRSYLVFFNTCKKVWIDGEASLWDSLSADYSKQWHLIKLSPSWKIRMLFLARPLIGMRNVRRAFLLWRRLKGYFHHGK